MVRNDRGDFTSGYACRLFESVVLYVSDFLLSLDSGMVSGPK